MQYCLPIYLPMYGIASLVIDGDARKIPDEEIDGRPALQGKNGLPIDQRQNPQEQFGLSEVHGINHAVIHSNFLTSNPYQDRVTAELRRETPA